MIVAVEPLDATWKTIFFGVAVVLFVLAAIGYQRGKGRSWRPVWGASPSHSSGTHLRPADGTAFRNRGAATPGWSPMFWATGPCACSPTTRVRSTTPAGFAEAPAAPSPR